MYRSPLLLLLILSLSRLATAGNCTLTGCGHHSSCNPDSQSCLCDAGYITLHPEQPCQYEQRQHLPALLLQLALGFTGAADFYLNLIGIGIGKALLTLFLYLTVFEKKRVDRVFVSGNYNRPFPLYRDFVKGILILTAAVVVTWWAVDDLRYGFNLVKDDHGVTLKRWSS